MSRRFIPIPPLTDVERSRFFDKVEVSGECHNWRGSSDKHGRGRVAIRRYPMVTSRVAYMIATGADPAELSVLHTCDNPRCVNPEHLKLGTQAENIADCVAKGRNARGSRNGHSYRFNEHIVGIIKRRIEAGERPTDIANDYGVGISQISHIKHGKKWRHVA